VAKVEPTVLLQRAEEARSSGKLKTAIRAYRDYVKAIPQPDSALLEKIGDLCLSVDDRFRAIDYYQDALKLTPSASVFLKLAKIHNFKLNHRDAIEVVDEALQVFPNDQQLLEEKLFALREISPWLLLDTANQLLAINAQNQAAYCYRAHAKLVSINRDLDGAQKDIDKALPLGPGDPFAVYCQGRLDIEQAKFDRALSHFNEARKGFAARNEKRMSDEAPRWYWQYKDRAAEAARKARFANLPIEAQIATLKECGLVLHPTKS